MKNRSLGSRFRTVLLVAGSALLGGAIAVLSLLLGWAESQNAQQLAGFAILMAVLVLIAAVLGLAILLLDWLIIRRYRKAGYRAAASG